VDNYSGQSYEHRRGWVEDRLLFLAEVFAIDICAFAVMNNHVHIVVCVDKALADSWPIQEVVKRWHQVHQGTLLSQKYAKGETLNESETISLQETANIYRLRLYDISWLMRDLNEYIAREANKEDKCTGRFWEGRFKSQALLDEGAVIACMAYVDLNPIRAKIEKTPQSSAHTSIKKRMQAMKNKQHQPKTLMAFVGNHRQNMSKGIAYHLKDYCELVDLTGRCIREDKAGYIDSSQSPILERLGLAPAQWLTLSTEFEIHFCYAAGSELMMQAFKNHTNHKRLRGMGKARVLLKRA
jgi:REP element-mobilizing transposase RayT